ncbi:permease [Streptomyces sp. RB110-1]|uniref:permease n=1 Tax=unclassified Streptomyces TaxID=2593676 RepID=UPI0019013A9E|nr:MULTISPECIES: permease [unclassified Streptomyces]MBK0376389.1 permease [Streptomyces sp. RB110-1]MBK0387237.1 permease [Streptomyces sp. RB110-2]
MSAAPPAQARRPGRLWLQLLRIGRAAARTTPGTRLRFWALMAASAAMALTALTLVTAHATFDGRAQREQARGPVLTESPGQATALWKEAFDSFGTSPHGVIYIEPLTPAATPPPGLSRWPAPGEAFFSHELARDAREHDSLDRYGRYGGTIAAQGLRSPSERIVYVRAAQAPADPAAQSWQYITGFGQAFPMNQEIYPRTLPETTGTITVLMAVPALALLVVATRVGSATRDRRSQLVNALGASWTHRAVINVGEAFIPVVAGTLLCLIPAALLLSFDLRLPLSGYIVSATDMRQAWPQLIAALFAALVSTLLLVVLLHRVQRIKSTTRPSVTSSRLPKWRLALCGVGVLAIALSQYAPKGADVGVFLAGTVLMWAMLPSAIAMVSVANGRRIAASGYRQGNPGRLIAGRWTASHPGVLVRLSVVFIIGIGLISHIQVWNSRLGDNAVAAQDLTRRVGDTFYLVHSSTLTTAAVNDLTRSLPHGAHVLAATAHPEGDHPRIDLTGHCRDLTALRLPCPASAQRVITSDPRLEELGRPYGGHLTVRAVSGDLDAAHINGSLIVATDEAGHRAQIERAAYAAHPGINVETPGEMWVIGAQEKNGLNAWLFFFGGLGLALLLVAGLISAAAEFVRIRAGLAPLSVLTGNDRVFRTIALWYLTVPLLTATAAATVITNWHSLFFIVSLREGKFSWPVLATASGGFALAAVAIGFLAAHSARRAAPSWRPHAD